MRGAELGRGQAQAVHAAVQLQPDLQRGVGLERFHRVHLPRRGHREPQLVLHDQWQLVGVEEAFQQQDRAADAGRAQFQRFFNAGHAERVGLAVQRARAGYGTVAIGVGLYRGQGLATAAQFTRQAEVGAQRIQVDQRAGWTHALGSLCWTDAAWWPP